MNRGEIKRQRRKDAQRSLKAFNEFLLKVRSWPLRYRLRVVWLILRGVRSEKGETV